MADACALESGTPFTEGESSSAWTFYVKRLARLLPVYALTNLLVLVLTLVLEKDKEGERISMAWRAPMTVFGVTSWSPLIQHPPNEVSWTISTLLAFYLAFPYLGAVCTHVHVCVCV
jgi:peptidoglycan/LPS O-acetylase OafA/YrhL